MEKFFQDGHVYDSPADAPDLGSVRKVTSEASHYMCLGADSGKLPTYDDLKTGSDAYCIDTGEVYIYEETTKQWYKQ